MHTVSRSNATQIQHWPFRTFLAPVYIFNSQRTHTGCLRLIAKRGFVFRLLGHYWGRSGTANIFTADWHSVYLATGFFHLNNLCCGFFANVGTWNCLGDRWLSFRSDWYTGWLDDSQQWKRFTCMKSVRMGLKQVIDRIHAPLISYSEILFAIRMHKLRLIFIRLLKIVDKV